VSDPESAVNDMRSTPARIITLGGASPSGSYLLRIRVAEDRALAFGRFRRGKIIEVPAGDYVYVGSALARTGSTSLARRLVRHATRTDPKPAHAIRDELILQFRADGLRPEELLPKGAKRLHWNVDHLLDLESAALVGVIAIRSGTRIERELGQLLERDPSTRIIEHGLGANDVRGNTHLMQVDADDAWWEALPGRVATLLGHLEGEELARLTAIDAALGAFACVPFSSDDLAQEKQRECDREEANHEKRFA
jgi:Uri superfamily endonuclease